LARTETIRAHHTANINEYKTWGSETVEVIAEFFTAGDDRVCSECISYHGSRFTIEEAEHLIPVHPNCRCIVVPVATRTIATGDTVDY
jgi:SPP1 gp7 family putative phage head morphogenesis protein